jgi:hypothetical protein
VKGTPKTLRAIVQAALSANHPSLDGTDKALLAQLALNADVKTGNGSRPGNSTLKDAAVLSQSAMLARIAKMEKIGLIKRTEVGDGRGRASVYRICFEHEGFPDYSRNECLTDSPACKPSGPDRNVSSANLPVIGPKPSGETNKPSCVSDKPSCLDRNTSEEHPKPTNPPSKPDTVGGWDGFLTLLPTEMDGAVARIDQRASLEALLQKHGSKALAGAVLLWIEKRDRPVDETLKAKWRAFLEEGQKYISKGAAKYAVHVKKLKQEAWEHSAEYKEHQDLFCSQQGFARSGCLYYPSDMTTEEEAALDKFHANRNKHFSELFLSRPEIQALYRISERGMKEQMDKEQRELVEQQDIF